MNVLRALAFVAAREPADPEEVERFQSSLTAEDWGEGESPETWKTLKPHASWEPVTTGTRTATLEQVFRELLADGRGSRGVALGVERLLEDESSADCLAQTLTIPKVEFRVRLSRFRSTSVRETFRRAIDLCDDPTERDRWARAIDFDVARNAIEQHLEELVQVRTYEVHDPLTSAHCIVKHVDALVTRGDRVALVRAVADPKGIHRLFILSRLKKAELSRVLGIPEKLIERVYIPPEKLPFQSAEVAANLLRGVVQ